MKRLLKGGRVIDPANGKVIASNQQERDRTSLGVKIPSDGAYAARVSDYQQGGTIRRPLLQRGERLQREFTLAVGVIVISTILNAGYFLPIVFRAFFREAPAGHEHGEAPWPILLALIATAVGTVLLFLMPDTALALAKMMIGR
jgi:hypothetical protein